MCGHTCEGFALPPVARLKEPRRDRAGLPSCPRRETGLSLLRQIEPIRGEPDCVLPLGRVLEAGQRLAHAHECLLPVRYALDLEPDPADEVALGAGQPLPAPLGVVGGIATRQEPDGTDVEPPAG